MPVFISQHFLTLVLLLSCLPLRAIAAPTNTQKESTTELSPLKEQEIPTAQERKNKIPQYLIGIGLQTFSGAIKEEGETLSGTSFLLAFENRQNLHTANKISLGLINHHNLLIQLSHKMNCCFQWGESYFYTLGITDNFVPTETINNLLQLKRYKITTSFGKTDLFIKNLESEIQVGWGLIGFVYQFNIVYHFPLTIQ